MLLLPTIQKQQNSVRAVYIHTYVHTYVYIYNLYDRATFLYMCTGEHKLNMLRVQLLAIGDATGLCTKFQALIR